MSEVQVHSSVKQSIITNFLRKSPRLKRQFGEETLCDIRSLVFKDGREPVENKSHSWQRLVTKFACTF